MRSWWRCLRRSRELFFGWVVVVAAVGDGALLSTGTGERRDAFTLEGPLVERDSGDNDDPDAQASADEEDIRAPGSLRRTLVVRRLVDGGGDDDVVFIWATGPADTFGLRVVEPGEMSISGPLSSNARVHELLWLDVGDDGDASTFVAGATIRSVGADRAGPPAAWESADAFSRPERLSLLFRLDEAILVECVELRPLDSSGSMRAGFTFEFCFDTSFVDLSEEHVDGRSLVGPSFLSFAFNESVVSLLRRTSWLVTE